MRYCSLGSGSKGNGTLIEQGQTRLLVDCGFSLRSTEQRLRQAGLKGEQLTAILVTHEHSDHIQGVAKLARRYELPVYLTPGTGYALREEGLDLRWLDLNTRVVIDELEVSPIAVPHDAREPCQFIFDNAQQRLGVLTDTGTITPWIIEQYTRLDALFLEANYDPHMLAYGPYPGFLKARVGGNLGHLSNQQAAGLLNMIDLEQLQHIAIAHISEKNNRPELARDALTEALANWTGELLLAEQNQGLPWQTISGLSHHHCAQAGADNGKTY
ncbi:MBL fold metallo-hydrolase [Halopseudomonas sabulinigri]|uniref:MBL fold metallo-hydrolase n=1 Tax=Halopseudomonas sabulinigri TaxID=472181 RepID=A0ABP9ZQR9_9GAMM